MTIRVLIVDDEPWARRRIATLLKAERDIEVVGGSWSVSGLPTNGSEPGCPANCHNGCRVSFSITRDALTAIRTSVVLRCSRT